MSDISIATPKATGFTTLFLKGFETQKLGLLLIKLIPLFIGLLVLLLVYGSYAYHKAQRKELMRLIGDETSITTQALANTLKNQDQKDVHNALRFSKDQLFAAHNTQDKYEFFILEKGLILAELSSLKSDSLGKAFSDFYPEAIKTLSRSFVQEGDVKFFEKTRQATLALPLGASKSLVVLRSYGIEENHFFAQQKRLAFIGLVVLIALFAYCFTQAKFITRFKNREKLALKETALMDRTLASSRTGLWAYDIEAQTFKCSTSLVELAGLSHSKTVFTSREMSKIVHEDDLVKFSLNTQTNEQDQVFRVIHANGAILWVRSRSKREDNLVMGLVEDITEQRTLEETSQQAEDRLNEALDALPSAFALWDADNRLVLTNKAFKDLHDPNRKELTKGALRQKLLSKISGPRMTLISPQGNEAEQTSDLKISANQYLQVISRRTKDGGLATVATDITRIKKHEAELSLKKSELTSKVKELERAKVSLENNRLILTDNIDHFKLLKQKADEASLAKSDFLAKMSHELRTPLNAILGFSEVLHNRQFGALNDEKYGDYPTDIFNAGKQLNDLVCDILDVTRIEAGKREIHLENFDILPVVTNIMPQVNILAQKKHVRIKLDVEDILIKADKRAIQQILLNLLTNAVKFSHPNGEVNLDIYVLDQQVVILVRDEGIGIPYNAIPRLCSPFEQVEGTYQRNHQGAGLGLYIVKSLVKLQNGDLHIASIVNEGTQIRITLPR